MSDDIRCLSLCTVFSTWSHVPVIYCRSYDERCAGTMWLCLWAFIFWWVKCFFELQSWDLILVLTVIFSAWGACFDLTSVCMCESSGISHRLGECAVRYVWLDLVVWGKDMSPLAHCIQHSDTSRLLNLCHFNPLWRESLHHSNAKP